MLITKRRWIAGVRQTVLCEDLVVLVRDPYNWRFGEIAQPRKINHHLRERVDAILHFHDGEEHVENLINCVTGEGLPGTSHSKPSIFYRHLEPRCYGGRLMAEQRQGLTQLVASYSALRVIKPDASWLTLPLLEMQYALLFGERFPLRTNPGANGNGYNGAQ